MRKILIMIALLTPLSAISHPVFLERPLIQPIPAQQPRVIEHHHYYVPDPKPKRPLSVDYYNARSHLSHKINIADSIPRCHHTAKEALRAIEVHDHNIEVWTWENGFVKKSQWQIMIKNLKDHAKAIDDGKCY